MTRLSTRGSLATETRREDGCKWQAPRDDLLHLDERINTSGEADLWFPGEYLVVLGRKRA